jgi:hypothetical protein
MSYLPNIALKSLSINNVLKEKGKIATTKYEGEMTVYG